MVWRLISAFFLAMALAMTAPLGGSAIAAGGGEKKAEKDDGKGEKKKKGIFDSTENIVPLPALVTPVTYRRKINVYLYVYLEAVMEDGSDAQVVKQKMPYIQDALVRAANKVPLVTDDPEMDPPVDGLINYAHGVVSKIIGTDIKLQFRLVRIDTAPYM